MCDEDPTLNIVFAAGGSGGHIVPAMAIAEVVSEKVGSASFFVCSKRKLDLEILKNSEYEFLAISSHPVLGKGIWGIIKFFFSAPRAFLASRRFIKNKGADVVVGLGGFSSIMPIIAATSLGIKTAIVEPNLQPGLANKFLAIFVDRVFCRNTREDLWWKKRGFYKINQIVRGEFLKIEENSQTIKNILVLGGSQGSTAINRAVVIAAKQMKKRFNWTIQAGKKHCDEVAKELPGARVFGFCNSLFKEVEKADLVISRAGANTVAEILASKRLAIFIPLPGAGGHQRKNVNYYEDVGATFLLEQKGDFMELGGEICKLLDEVLSESEFIGKVKKKLFELQKDFCGAEDVALGLMYFRQK